MSAQEVSALPWLLVAEGELDGARVTLDREEAQHLRGALRRRVGDRVALADGCGAVAVAVLSSLAGSAAVCEVEEVRRHPRPAGDGVTVGLSVLHGRAMDWAVQKAVEVGARRFVPVIAGRSQLDLRASGGRQPHWLRVARQALKQCRRPWAMEVESPTPIEEYLGAAVGAVARADGVPVDRLPVEATSRLLVGPEGGFTDHEEELAERSGWARLRLGPHVLRAETALVLGTGFLIGRHERDATGGKEEAGG